MSKKFLVAAFVLTLVSTVVALSGCGGEGALGESEDNPIIWSFVPSGETEQVATGAQEVADLLHDETGLYFDTNVATEYAGVIEAMCADPPKAHMGSLATFAYVLANERCGVEAALVASRFGSPTYNGQLITQADSGIDGIEDLEGKTFCRPDPLSTSGWIIPSLSIRAEGLNPQEDLAEIVDAGSHDAVVAAVYNGDCDAGATYVDARGTLEEEQPDVMERVVVFHITADIPNDGVQFAPDFDEELRDEIVEGLLAISETEEGQDALDTAYSWAGLERHGDEFYDPFRQVLQASGVSIEDLQQD
jgi:phosphonate transport system substrate-binding protein